MKANNKYQLLEPVQSDPRKELTIGNYIWIKVLLEMIGGFGNGYILRLIPILLGFLLGFGVFLVPAGLIPTLIIGLSIGAGILLGLFYGWDQYKISSRKNKKELSLIIKNREWNTTSNQMDRLVGFTNDDYLLLTDTHQYTSELEKYINERRVAERLNRRLKAQVKQQEQEYKALTGNSVLTFTKALPHPAVYITYPATNDYSLPKQPVPKADSWWQWIKNSGAGLKQGINYIGIPAGLMLATMTTFVAAASTVTSLGIVLFMGIIIFSLIVGGQAICYQLRYEYPQEKKMEKLKQENKYLQEKCRIQKNELQDRLNYIHFQNQHLANRLRQLTVEMDKIRHKQQVLKSNNVSYSKDSSVKREQATYFKGAKAEEKSLYQPSKPLRYRASLANE